MKQEINEGIALTRYALWQVAWKILLPIGLVVLLVVVLARPFQVADRVLNPDRMIYTYEHFHDLYQKIEACDKKIELKEAEPVNKWTRVELSGLREHRTNLVAEYNADAAKVTRSFLLDSRLPERINQ